MISTDGAERKGWADDQRPTARLLRRFYAKFLIADGCWEWAASLNDAGYGQMSVNGVPDRAHRISWHIHRGEIPDGLFVLHKCDNRRCVKPDHLFLGTHADNMRDMSRKGRHFSRTKPEALHRGDDHYSRRRPERLARGSSNGMAKHPELVRGERNPAAKLTTTQVTEAINAYANGETQTSIARRMGVTQSTISLAVLGKTWKVNR
jgi:hypothetical protein